MSISQIEQILSEVPIFPERIKTPYDEYVPQGHALFDFFHTTMQPEYNLLREQYNSLSVSINASALLVDSHYNNVVDMASTVQKLRDETVIANNEIKNYVVPTEAVDSQDLRDIKDKNILNSVFNAYGYTKDVGKNRWLETDIPNTIVDSVSEPIRFSKGLVEREVDSKVVLPNAPFADSTDELLSYQTATDGIKTAIAHEAGDIVHIGDGAELVGGTNFDGSLTPNDTTISFDGSTVAGVMYGIKVFVSAVTAGVATIAGFNISANGNHSTTSDNIIDLIADADFDGTVTVSIVAIEQTYQAIDTVPTETALNDTSKFSKVDFISRQDPILLCEDGKYRTFKGYKNFEANFSVDNVANGYGFDKLGKGLFSVTDLDCINDAGDPDNYTGEVVIVGVVPRLNAKMFNLVFNRLGSYQNNDGEFWYNETTKVESVYGLLNVDVGSVSGHPADQTHDRVALEKDNCLIFKPSYAVSNSKHDLLSDVTSSLVSGDGSMVCNTGVELIYSSGPLKTIDMSDGTSNYFKLDLQNSVYSNSRTDESVTEIVIMNLSRNTIYSSITTDMIGSSYSNEFGRNKFTYISFLDSNPFHSQGDILQVQVVRRNNQLLSQNLSLATDMVGNPAKYISTDATVVRNAADDADILAQIGGDETAVFGENTLVWHIADGKMYRITNVDNDYKIDADGDLYDDTNAAKATVTDVAVSIIGRYLDSWYNRLDNGLALPFNPLLVSDTGGDYTITRPSWSRLKVSNKATSGPLVGSLELLNSAWNIRSDSGLLDLFPIENTLKGRFNSGYSLTVWSYISKNTVQPTTPNKTIAVSNKIIATSSHSVYQGAMLSNAVTGKVSVADVERGFESKAVLDTMYDSDGILISQPSHNPLSLSISDSPASKLYTSLEVDDNGEILLAVTGEELINDLTSEGDIDGTDGTVDLISNRIYKVTVGNHTGRYIATSKAFTEIKLDDYTLGSDGKFRDLNNTVLDGLVEYLGSGFGDTGEFEQLTNGTTEDLNGNVVRTYHGSVRIGYYIGDE